MPTFSLLTLNCFGVPSPSTKTRLLTLCRELDALRADVVCLQEVQAHPYRRLLARAATGYPHCAYEPFVHAPKGGLFTLSRYPIIESRFVLYRERGLWYTPALADWILHKGALITRLQIDQLPVVVFNTHLTANYTGHWGRHNLFARHEWEQLQQLAELVNEQPANALVLVAGDFNIPRGSWLSDEFLKLTGLIDPLAGDHRPTFRLHTGMPARYAAAIDFGLLRVPSALQMTINSGRCLDHKYRLLNGQEGFLSDHDAIELRLSWTDREGDISQP